MQISALDMQGSAALRAIDRPPVRPVNYPAVVREPISGLGVVDLFDGQSGRAVPFKVKYANVRT